MKISTLKRLVLCGFILFFNDLAVAQNINQRALTELESVIQKDIKLSGAPGAILAFVQNGKIIYQKPFGVSSKKTKIPVNNKTLFLTASVTKTITTTALLMACEERGIDLQTPVGSFLKELSPKLAQIKIHEILSMQSGIIDFLPAKNIYKEDIKAYFQHFGDQLVSHELRFVYSYTNIGHVLAGELLATITGTPYMESIQKMIFDPLKMESTTFLESVAQTKGYSAGHKKGTKVAHKLTYPFIRSAASMFSNINDLSQFANCFMNDGVIDNRQVISKNVIIEMATAYTPIGVLHQYLGYPDSKYNYGLIGFTFRGIQFLGHPGESGSQNILFVMAPEHKAIFILMSNTGSYPFIQSFEKMVETFLPVQPYVTTHQPLIDINKYTGKYYRPNIKNNKYDTLYIRARGKKLYIDLGEEDTYLLSQSGEHRFTYNSPNIKWAMEIKFYTNIKGQVKYVNNAWRTFVKIK